jgi:hypothetical protein
MKRSILGIAAVALALCGAEQARADLVYTLGSGSDPFQATADFAFAPGGFVVTVTNTEPNTPDAGHAISLFTFTVNGTTLGVPSSWTEVKGNTNDFAGNTGFSDATPSGSPPTADHWSYSVSSNTVTMNDLSTAQPDHLIVHTGSTVNGSLNNTHQPSFVGGVQYFYADATLPKTLDTTTITSVTFAFGTTADEQQSSKEPGIPTAAPEPSTLLGAATGVLMLAGYAWRKRHRARVAA